MRTGGVCVCAVGSGERVYSGAGGFSSHRHSVSVDDDDNDGDNDDDDGRIYIEYIAGTHTDTNNWKKIRIRSYLATDVIGSVRFGREIGYRRSDGPRDDK